MDENKIGRLAQFPKSRTALIVIGGTQHASGEIKALAERLNAPVVANHMGLGVLDSRHPLSFNFLGGVFLWEETDVVIAIGTRLMLQDFGFAGKKIIRIDIDEDQIGLSPPTLHGDAATVTGALTDALSSKRGTGWETATFEWRYARL